MLTINKITSDSVVDYAALELKKYLRMMMPEGGDIKISYDPLAKEGFRLGLMQDFGLDVSDAEEPELDDILYIKCDTDGGVIAGDNPRSVLLAVYEYLRQNGCRWLLPGVDGEFIPMKNIEPVEYRHKPSCRYRGWCNEGAEFQQCMLDAIEFAPKIGLNVFMLEFFIPIVYYRAYYSHLYNSENLPPEPVNDATVLAWKRQCEAEIAKRGLQFHDIGHGWTTAPFGIPAHLSRTGEDNESYITDENREMLAMINGERKLYGNYPMTTNFCMSNPKARRKVARHICEYARTHSNSDYLHIWLADGTNNHCECEQCQKKTPSDFYMMLMNDIDEELTEAGLSTRIVFINYVDTTWAPITERIKNPKRFTMLFAPIFRSYEYSLPEGKEKTPIVPYARNKNVFPKDLQSSFDYFHTWDDVWQGANVAYEYHFWRHMCYDLSGLHDAELLHNDVKLYKKEGVNGIIQDGTQRAFMPNGLTMYSYARTLFDTSITFDEIVEDYFKSAYGECWKDVLGYLKEIRELVPFGMISRDCAAKNAEGYYNEANAQRLGRIYEILEKGKKIIADNYNSDFRLHTVSVRLLEYHAELLRLISGFFIEKFMGRDDVALKLYDEARIAFGKHEAAIKSYFDHTQYFSEYKYAVKTKPKTDISNVI